MLAAKLRSVQLVTHFQRWKRPRRFVGHTCYLLSRGGSLELFSLSICIEQVRLRKAWFVSMRSEWVLAGWNP